MVRMYFNKWGRDDLPWSVDLGHQSSEVQVKSIRLFNVTGLVHTDLRETNRERPKAWIEFPAAIVSVENGIATIEGVG